MKIILTADSVVRFKVGDIVEVSPEEAERLKAFGVAEEYKEKKPKAKK